MVENHYSSVTVLPNIFHSHIINLPYIVCVKSTGCLPLSLPIAGGTNVSDAEIEALNTLKAAKALVHSGKKTRAEKLLEHAFSLAPRHPDVLIHYGEYLEQHRKDVVQADKMYLQALAVSPANSRALR